MLGILDTNPVSKVLVLTSILRVQGSDWHPKLCQHPDLRLYHRVMRAGMINDVESLPALYLRDIE